MPQHRKPANEDAASASSHSSQDAAGLPGEVFRILDRVSGVGVAVFDLRGSLVHASSSLLDLLGLEPDQAGSLNFRDFAPLKDSTAHTPTFSTASRSPAATRERARFLRHDGELFWADMIQFALADEEGKPSHVVRLIRDITRELEQEDAQIRQQLGSGLEVETRIEGSQVTMDRRLAMELVSRVKSERIMSAIHVISRAVTRPGGLPDLLDTVHEVVGSIMAADNFYIALKEPATGSITFPLHVDERDERPGEGPHERGLTAYVLRTGRTLFSDRAGLQRLFASGQADLAGTMPEHWLGVPLINRRGLAIGVMAVQSYDPGEAYDEEDRVLLELISTHVAGAMEYKAAEEALRASEAKFRAIFDHAGIGIALLDLKGRILDMNATGQSIIGYELDELTDLDFTDYNHPEDAARSRELFAQLLCGEREHFEIVKRYIHKLGHVSWGRQVVTLVRGVRGEAGFAISMLEDITEHKKADDALRHMAYHDALTGLPNRILFQERLERAISRERRGKGRVFAVLFLDLDRFKIINDSLGHAFGDKLLVAITRRVSECIREVDTLARFGGDEFAILLDGMDDTRFVSRVIGRIQEQFSRPFFIEEHEVFAAASIGVVAKTWLYEDAEDILRDADTAMYRAKEAGTGSFAIFDHAMHEQARGRLRWETSLRRALDQGRIIPFYQPIVDLDTGETTALEALARWPHSERGMIPPAEFIPVAEETGLIHAIDMGILATACRTLVDITGRRARAANLALHVNISARTFQLQENLPREVARILDKTGLAPSRLKLEITENLLLWGVPRVEGMIAELTRLGVGLVMDDFGTGYSSLSALRNFPFTSLKIEGSFIRSMEESPEDAGILETILKLGRTLGMDVVAEGVETASQAAALQRLDCGYMQGFLAARPMDAAALEELLAGEAPLRLLHNAAHPESRT